MNCLGSCGPNGFPEQNNETHHDENTSKAQKQKGGGLHIGHTKARNDEAGTPDKYKQRCG
jgi:hypothetical protein